jgi:hypothetical protein
LASRAASPMSERAPATTAARKAGRESAAAAPGAALEAAPGRAAPEEETVRARVEVQAPAEAVEAEEAEGVERVEAAGLARAGAEGERAAETAKARGLVFGERAPREQRFRANRDLARGGASAPPRERSAIWTGGFPKREPEAPSAQSAGRGYAPAGDGRRELAPSAEPHVESVVLGRHRPSPGWHDAERGARSGQRRCPFAS